MNKLLLALAGIILSVGLAYGQAPPPAAAVGYNTLTFGGGTPSIVVGNILNPVTSYPFFTTNNWAPYAFAGSSWTGVGYTVNSDGSVTLNGAGEAFGNGLATAAPGNLAATGSAIWTGMAFGGGFYAVAHMKGTGPMAFWANDIESQNNGINGLGNNPWKPTQPPPPGFPTYGDWMELDIAEFDSTNVYGGAMHNWYAGNICSGNSFGQNFLNPPGTQACGINSLNSGSSFNFPPTNCCTGADFTAYHDYGMLWVPATATTQGSVKWYFDGAQVGNTYTWNKYNPSLGPPPVDTGHGGSSAYSVLDMLHVYLILGGPSGTGGGTVATTSSVQVWQASNANDLINGGPPTPPPTKVPVPAPLQGSVSTQTWVAVDQSYPGVTLACGKPFHYNVLPPAQYAPSNYIYPLYIWLHPDFQGDPWYLGSNTNALFLTNDEAGGYNTVPFLTNYPGFVVAPYADQTNGNGTASSCHADGNDAVQNWGGWFNNGAVGSGTVYSGDTGPNTFALIQMILNLEANYSIDPNRIYCNGFSLGGIGCEYLMQHYNAYTGDKGKYFAAGASEAGVDQADTPVTGATATLLQTVPMWYFSGASDGDSPPSAYNTPLCSALGGNPSSLTAITSPTANRCGGGAMRYTLCPTCGHQDTDASGNPVWTNTTINTFLFGQSATGGVTPPPAETITVSTIATQASATPFTVSGTIGGLSAAPTLQYSVNGGTWLALPTSSGTRNAYNQPGSNASVWNTPFGSGAIWSNAYHNAICYVAPTTTGACTGIINPVNNFGVTDYTSTSPADPTFAFSGPNGRTIAPDNGGTLSATLHVPTGAFTPGPYPGDNPFILQDQTSEPNRQYTWSGIQPSGVAPPGLQAGQGPFTAAEGAEWDDITSDTYGQDYDTGLSGFNLGDGVINACDVSAACNPFYPQIKHALRYMLPVTNFASNATTPTGSVLNPSGWPDRLQDTQTGPNVYTGTLPFGFTLGIPASTAMPAGLDANCQGLFWTLQHYPLFPRDAAAGGFHLSMDQTAITSAYGASATSCLPTLVNLLQVMTNQHQGGQSFATNPANGPGTRTDTGPLALGSGGTTSVTATSFFFTEPGLAAGAANTIAVRDASNTGTFGTSNSFVVTGSSGVTPGAALSPGFVSVAGSQFRDGSGNNERLACTGYGNPTGNPSNDMTLIRAQGFNCAQVPWFDKVTCPGGACSFSAFDPVVAAANAVGLRIVFVHQSNEGTNGTGTCTSQQANGLWYDLNGAAPWAATNGTDGCGTVGTVTYATFKSDWVQFATHYAGNATVIGFDLHNEPTTFGNPTCCATAGGGGTGQFTVTGGQIHYPNGNLYIPVGVNLNDDQLGIVSTNAAVQPLTTLFPGINHIRLRTAATSGLLTPSAVYPSPSIYAAFIAQATAQGIVVEIEDHSCNGGDVEGTTTFCQPPTGATLTPITNWYAALANAYKNNPFVWFGSLNEPCSGDSSCSYTPSSIGAVSTYQLAIYNAVRATGAGNMMQMLAGIGGGNCGTVGSNGGFIVADYAAMHNIIWELHSYYSNGTLAGATAQLTGSNAAQGGGNGGCGYVAAQSIQSADGLVPVIFGEVGSGDGNASSTDGSDMATALGNIGVMGFGSTAWHWDNGNAQWQLVNNGYSAGGPFSLTTWGTEWAATIARVSAASGSSGGGGGSGAIGAGWGTGTGADMKAMVEDTGAAVEAADPGSLILVEGILNNATLFNGTARGSASLPITAGSIGDLSTIGTNPVACCTGHVAYAIHDNPTDISGTTPDSGSGATTMRNTAWGYLLTGGKAPVWIGRMGASLDNTNGNQADETAWATSLTQYMNGQLGAQGGPTFTGCTMPLSGDWFNYGYLPSQQPDGTLNQDNSNKSGQQAYWGTLLYTTCTGGGGIGATTWNPGDKSAAMVLSNGNLTATDTITERSDSVRATTAQTTGKRYFEITATTSSTDWSAGLANSSFPLTTSGGLGSEGNGIGFYNVSPTQYIYYNGTALSTGTTAGATGDVIYYAVDLTNHLEWVSSPVMRAASTPWNSLAIGSANPATGVGGIPFAGLTCPCFPVFNDEEAGAATINAGGPFTGTVPTGFTAWQPTVTSGGRVLIFNSLW